MACRKEETRLKSLREIGRACLAFINPGLLGLLACCPAPDARLPSYSAKEQTLLIYRCRYRCLIGGDNASMFSLLGNATRFLPRQLSRGDKRIC